MPYWGDAGLGGLGGVSQSGSVGRYDEGKAEAETVRKAACVGTGSSVEAVTAALVTAGATSPGCSETLLGLVLVLGGGGIVVGGSWDCCAVLENPHQDAAAAGASGGCSGEAFLGLSAVVGAHPPLLLQHHLAAADPALVLPVQVEVEGLLVLLHLHPAHHLVLVSRPLDFAAAVVASASAAGSSAEVLHLLERWCPGSPAADLIVLVHPVAPLAAVAAEGPLHLHLQAGVGKRGASLPVLAQTA